MTALEIVLMCIVVAQNFATVWALNQVIRVCGDVNAILRMYKEETP